MQCGAEPLRGGVEEGDVVLWATLFLHERLDLLIVVVAVVVLVSVAGSKRSAIAPAT